MSLVLRNSPKVSSTSREAVMRAVAELLARIARPDTPGETVLLPPRLEIRSSTGPAPAVMS